MVRRNIRPVTKVLILTRQGGACSECGTKTGPFEYEHVKPLWLGGRDHPDNLTAKCVSCHKAKTVAEASNRAKMKRIREQDGLLKRKLNKREKYIRSRSQRRDL